MKSFEKITPQLGQESVWDYPRPPKIEAISKTIRIEHKGIVLVNSNKAFRILETSHPPVYYIPQEDILMEHLALTEEVSFCEFKGKAHYYHLQIGKDVFIRDVAWTYLNPPDKFSQIKEYLAFYPNKLEACFVNDEKVNSQDGSFYGGWITKDIVGPFKGGSGTWGW
jgi:uncharacterized protein (DUF427 family)